jgi:hypothetical protein
MDEPKKKVYEKCQFDPLIELILKEQKQKKPKKGKVKKEKPVKEEVEEHHEFLIKHPE